MSRGIRATRTSVALAAVVLGTMTSAAAADTTGPQWNCRASALFASVVGGDRVEPVVANGNPNTAQGVSPDFAFCGNGNAGADNLATPLGNPRGRHQRQDALSDHRDRTGNGCGSRSEGRVRGQGREPEGPAGHRHDDSRCHGSQLVCDGRLRRKRPEARRHEHARGRDARRSGHPPRRRAAGRSTDALAPLAPIVEVKVNEKIQDATSLTVRALHVKLLAAAGTDPLVDLIVAESKVVAPGRRLQPCANHADDARHAGKPCPPGSELDLDSERCVIRATAPTA